MNEKKLIVILASVLCVCVGAILYLVTTSPSRTAITGTEVISQPIKTASRVGGAFTMVDHNGQTVTDQNYAGNYKLMFFGFTNCPGICPGELTRISDVLDILKEDGQGQNITPIFVSIDPARDTPEVVKEYVEVYDERFIGLTGSQEQVNDIKDAYKVHASKVEMDMMDPGMYMMDHSTFTYLMSPENELLLVFDMQDKVKDIAEEIKTVL